MKIVILDRDGVINYDSPDFIKTPDEWIAIPGSLEAIANLNKNGYDVIVCSNQSGIARKLFTHDTLNQINQKMKLEAEKLGGRILDIFYCPHKSEDNCNCRKPKTQMLKDICIKYNIKQINDLMMVGDSSRDLIAIHNFGGVPVLVKTGNGIKTLNNDTIPSNTMVFDNLLEFSQHIITTQMAVNVAVTAPHQP
jgi:D-glycero-D-manno-heptose 1,7-bisphosphate phosphatase